MINFCRTQSQFLLQQLAALVQHPAYRPILTKTLSVSVLSIMGLLSGVIPGLGDFPKAGFQSAAYAQAITNDEVKNYARTALAIEQIRLSAYNDIKKITASGEVPAIACNKSESFNQIPENIRSIAVNYCNQSKKIVESNGLPISRFNAIKMGVEANPDLEKRVQDALLDLQKFSSPKPN